VFAKDAAAIRVDLAEGYRSKAATALKAEAETADTAEEVEEPVHQRPSGSGLWLGQSGARQMSRPQAHHCIHPSASLTALPLVDARFRYAMSWFIGPP
jgi:hypothetical protein